MKAVCNASPLIALGKAGLLGVLHGLFERVVVPAAVVREVQAGGPEDEGVNALTESPWLERVELAPPVSRLAALSLGAGEAEVIEWALRNPGFVVILDDRAARRAAESLGVACMGTLRVLYEGSGKGLVPAFPEAVRRLRAAGLYCDERTVAAVIRGSSSARQP